MTALPEVTSCSTSRGPGESERFAEGEAVELAAADFAGGDIFHLRGNEVDGAFHFFATRSIAVLHDWGSLVILPDGSFGLVDDHDLGTGLGYPDHFLDGARLVGEEVDSADVEDTIKGFNLERQALGFGLEQMSLALPLEKVALALAEHSPGDIDAVEIDVARQVAEICSGADGGFEYAGVGLQLKIADEIETVVGFAGEPVIETFGQVVAGSDAIVKNLVFEI